MTISIRNIVKQSAKFSVVNIISLLLKIPNQIIIGIFLLPEEYGIISFVALLKLYAGLINPGMLSAAQREIPYLIGKKEVKQFIRVQNIAISSDFLYSILPFLAIFCTSFFYSNKMIKIGLIIAAFSFFTDRFVSYYVAINFIKQNFTVVAIGRLIGSILSPIIIIISIYWLGVYAVLIAPLICTLFVGIYYFKKAPIGYSFKFEWAEIVRLIKIGFVFSLSGLIFYVYRMADRTIIASFLSLHDLGLFTFAVTFVMLGINFLADFGRVFEPILWEHSGKVKNTEDSFNNTKRMAIYMALVTAMVIPLVQVGYGVTVKLFLPKYVESIPLFLILSNMLYLASIATIPVVILNSVVINKQAFVITVFAIGAGINIIFDLFIVYVGYGIEAIATFVLYFLARKYMIKQRNELILFFRQITLPFIISVLFSVFHGFFFGSTILSLWLLGAISLLSQIIIWYFMILLFYRGYLAKDKVISIIKELYELAFTGIKKKINVLTITR